MTLREAERLLGCQIEDRSTPGVRWFVAIDSGSEVGSGSHGTNRSLALRKLVDQVYHDRAHQVYRAQDYKCADCGRRRPLTPHHEKFRSHRGTHVKSNICGLCLECHDKRHKKRSK